MKIAILHDFLRSLGGTERVLLSLLNIFPEAEIYTLVTNDSVIKKFSFNKKTIHSSFISYLPIVNEKTSIIQLLSPLLWSSFNLQKFDLVISSSSYGLSPLINTGKILHIHYIHSIPKNLFISKYYLSLQKVIPYHMFYSRLYRNALKTSPYLLTNSIYMKGKLKKEFGVTAKVIYPPVFIPKKLPGISKKEYYIYVGRLDKNKSIDLAIHACNYLKLPFKIIGVGPELENLKKIAGPTIEFLGFIPDNKLTYYYQKAKAFIFCAKEEDFGIAPIEAMGYGVPVIAYYGGGIKETLEDKVTGRFFYQNTVESLINILSQFNYLDFKPAILYKHVQKFSETRFRHDFEYYVRRVTNRQ